jgi:hypothetical protein
LKKYLFLLFDVGKEPKGLLVSKSAFQGGRAGVEFLPGTIAIS